jgi:CheY-like chemotaxis protein
MPLDDLIDQGLELVEPDLQRLGITIQRHRDERVMVSVDPPQLVQVVIHLLTNARDAMPTGGELLIRTTIRNTLAEFVITDTGSGIPPAVRERLFEPFVTTKGVFGGGDQEGVGLGLSICYTIVHGHGGTIDVESPQAGGSTFIVRLPLHIEEGDAAPVDALVPSKRRALRVLVVDDDSLIQALLRTTLIRAGYFVLFASDAEGARVLVHQGGLDVIVCSLSLPGVDGLELAQQLYAEGWHIPFVLMTGRIDGPGLARARSEPIASVLLKPFQPHDVLSILKAVVARTAVD